MNVYPDPFHDDYRASPLTLVDVGASGGIQRNWQPHRRFLKVIGFEPDRRAYRQLQQAGTRVQYFNTALFDLSCEKTLYLTEKQQNSSFFKPNMEFLQHFPKPERFNIVAEEVFNCRNLDDILSETESPEVDFIKLDTQGAELAILEGASDTVSRTVFGLEIEVQFAPLYEDSPMFADIDRFLRRLGFDLIDLRPVYWKRTAGARVGNSKGQLVFADALYFRRLDRLQGSLPANSPSGQRGKILRCLSICQVYGFLDMALEIVERLGRNDFSDAERAALKAHLKAQAPAAARFPNFRGRKALFRMSEKLTRALAPRSHKLAPFKLGNFHF